MTHEWLTSAIRFLSHRTQAELLLAIPALTVHVVERRGRHAPLNAHRQIDIATLIESMPEAVFVFDSSGRIVEVNSATERMFCLPSQEIKKATAEDLGRCTSDNATTPHAPEDIFLGRVLRGESVHLERRTMALPGQSNSVEAVVSANPLRNDNNEIVGALVIVRDVTELTTLQRRMAETEQHNAIGKMAAGLAHDFNNVLQTIEQAVTVLEMSADRPLEERAVFMRMIRNAVKRGSEIVVGVREYLTGAGDQVALVDLNTLVEEAVELTRPLWQPRNNISIERHFQPVPRVRANPQELRRIFTNLVINSLEAMPNGGTLAVGCEYNSPMVGAFIADTGEGITVEKQKKIFRPYYTTKKGGTGLGLATAQRAVHAMRGKISFKSKPGEGTRFSVELPEAEQERKAS